VLEGFPAQHCCMQTKPLLCILASAFRFCSATFTCATLYHADLCCAVPCCAIAMSCPTQKGLRPHNYCLPILKRERHREAVAAAATSGSTKFFLGTDRCVQTIHCYFPKHLKCDACLWCGSCTHLQALVTSMGSAVNTSSMWQPHLYAFLRQHQYS
jgi:hypothetical protein